MNRNLKEKIRKDIESLLVLSPMFYNGCKGYLLVEINGVLRCYHLRSNQLTFEFSDQPLENISVMAVIDDWVDKECDLKKIIQSIAYSDKKYSSLVNKINNKRKELNNIENLEKKLIDVNTKLINVSIKRAKELSQMNLTGADLTREIEKSAAVQMSEQASSKRLKKVKCSKCGADISTIAMEDDAVCRGIWTRCKCPICHDWFEIRINTDKIK